MLKKLSSLMVRSITPMSMRLLCFRPSVNLNGCSRIRSIMSMSTRSLCFRPPVAINGFGRIGKIMVRKSFQEDSVNVIAINQPWASVHEVADSLRYDTVHGPFNKNVDVVNDCIKVDGRLVKVLHEPNIENICWSDLGVEYVIDSTGSFTSKSQAIKHIELAGATNVIVTGPVLDTEVPMFIRGVNFEKYAGENLVSSASCTTNCATILLKILNDKFGVKTCMLYTVHALTASQRIHDWMDIRSGLKNILPSTTGASKAIGLILPYMDEKLVGDASRVPVMASSLLRLYVNLSKNVDCEEIQEEIVNKSRCDMPDVLSYVDNRHVSSDFIGCPFSAVVDFRQIQMIDSFLTVSAWYDNETAYACRVLDLAEHMMDYKPCPE